MNIGQGEGDGGNSSETSTVGKNMLQRGEETFLQLHLFCGVRSLFCLSPVRVCVGE